MSLRSSRFLVVFTLAALAALPASARELRVLARMGLDGGGDTIQKVTLSDGSSQSLSAGGLFTIAAGLMYLPVGTPLALEATIGYKVDDVTASNGKLTFDRWPLELLASYRIERHRIGGGLAYHLSPTYTCRVDGASCGGGTTDDALGAVVQYAYGDLDGPFLWDVGARVTIINYNPPAGTLNGTSFGAFVSLGF